MTIKEQIIDLRKRGLLYPEIVDSLGCTYEYVKDTCRKNNLGYSKYELAKSSGRFKPYKDWQKVVDDYYGGSGIAEVIDQHRSSNGETKVTVRCVKCGDVKKLSSVTLRHKNLQGRCLKCQKNQTQKKKFSERFEREWREEYQKHVDGDQVGMRFCECGQLVRSGHVLCEKCSGEHRRIQQRRRDKKKELIRRSRCKGGDYSITLNELYERDNGICKLCGHLCDWEDYTRSGETFIAGDYYPSIDHIKPLSKGGEHNWSNVQLAHRICNSIKSDR